MRLLDRGAPYVVSLAEPALSRVVSSPMTSIWSEVISTAHAPSARASRSASRMFFAPSAGNSKGGMFATGLPAES